MRPVRLTIQAFGPFAGREVIDFRDAVAAGLFGIYGRTGSGKSTIFSAMTFALFGEPAKGEQDAPSLRSDHADAAAKTEVEFIFDVGEKRFAIVRRPEQMRPKQRGEGETSSPHEAFLFDATGMAPEDIGEGHYGKIVAEKKVRAVDTAIVEMLGYGSEQFRQIVLLPQGRFETFLSAKTKERMEILRDLFDVSLYRHLAAKLKEEADAAERLVVRERELCARRLAAEGFESTDALAAGITEAEARHAELQEGENAARMVLTGAQKALDEARGVEARFVAAEKAWAALAALKENEAAMAELADQVERAERARLLVDPETYVRETAREARDAGERLAAMQERLGKAETRATAATEALAGQTARAGEIDDLRREIDAFERQMRILERAAETKAATEAALKAERAAETALGETGARLQARKDARGKQAEALRRTRETEARRHDIASRLRALTDALSVASTFEAAEAAVGEAQRVVSERTAEVERLDRRAAEARAASDTAEHDLTRVQALYLATKLEPGAPCPVCGATDHPAPATGSLENAGLEAAFRKARAAREAADGAAREAGQRLASAQSILDERQRRLAETARPEEGSSAIREKLDPVRAELEALGPETDIAEAEATLDRLAAEIDALEKKHDGLRDDLAERRQATATLRAQLEEMLSSVPDHLRDNGVLARETDMASRLLAGRVAARDAAEKADREAHDALLGARKDVEAAEVALAAAKTRQQSALEVFRLRLEDAGFSRDDYRDLKPAIATLETDRARLDDYRQTRAAAEEGARTSAEAVRDRARPDLDAFEESRRAAEESLTTATNARMATGHHLGHLTKLRNELAEILRTLDEAEAASGPLRGLSALVNGNNPQKLDLETFAIGAMFDQVLEAANLRLHPMSANRYRLERDREGAGRGRRGLGIQVFDTFTGKSRPTATLSGGETFIAALALALGLADVVESASGRVRLDTIFIDEGFGSLDTENGSGTLDQVLQVLNSLVSQNRAVGLISHVPLVQEAIPNGFYVRKHFSGSNVNARGPV